MNFSKTALIPARTPTRTMLIKAPVDTDSGVISSITVKKYNENADKNVTNDDVIYLFVFSDILFK